MLLRVLALGVVMGLAVAVGSAQENHQTAANLPLSVETLPTEPTVVKTGDLITQAYRVRFADLLAEGKEIIVLEDRMAPENLAVAPFEGVALRVEKRRLGDEHIWDFVYQFRIVNPAKATHMLPSFSVYWLTRDLGEEIDELEVARYETDPVPVRYVTTIPDEGAVDIRDVIRLGAFSRHAALFRAIEYGVAPLPLVLWIVMLVGLARQPRRGRKPRQQVSREAEIAAPSVPENPSVRDARRSLRRDLARFGAVSAGDDARTALEAERALVISLREYLRAEVPELNPGDTPKEIQRYIEARLRSGARKEALGILASRLVSLQSGLEKGTPGVVTDPVEEARTIQAVVDRLRPHMRVVQRATGLLKRDQPADDRANV
jgi:hypothetical protein